MSQCMCGEHFTPTKVQVGLAAAAGRRLWCPRCQRSGCRRDRLLAGLAVPIGPVPTCACGRRIFFIRGGRRSQCGKCAKRRT